IPAKPRRQDATWMRARLAASPARAGRTKPAITSELTAAQPTGPNGPGRPSARRGTRAQMRERLVGSLEDALDLFVGQRPDLTVPGPPAQVLAQPRPAEDVDLPDRGHVPRDARPVYRHRRTDADRLAGHAVEQVGRLLCLPLGVLEPVLLAERTVPQLGALLRPHGQPLVPVLRVDGEDAGWPDDQVVDLVLALRDGPGVHGTVARAAEFVQLPAGPPLRGGQPDLPGVALAGPVDGVGDDRDDGERQPELPRHQDQERHQDDDRDDGPQLPDP